MLKIEKISRNKYLNDEEKSNNQIDRILMWKPTLLKRLDLFQK